MPTFSIGDTDFLLDGKPHQIISGAMHYFRIHPDLWADRLRTARLMGLNTIETYVPWNEHAPERGTFRTDGILDLGRFLDLIAAEGMHAIVRPGPYICAEWDDGGLPGWLLSEPEVRLRTSDPTFVAPITEYLRAVYDIVRSRQITDGGNVILVQIENEYGAYGNDADYLQTLVDVTHDAGIAVPLTTVDQPVAHMLEAGGLPGLHRTGSFGSQAKQRLATLREHQRTGPLMCSEFWCGWFDSRGEHHHTTPAADSAAELETLLAAGASVNIYMVHGGTNFGLVNGANHKGTYRPISTSYDYDAPIAEDGTPTAKYWAFRDVISRHAPVPDEKPRERTAAPTLTVELGQRSALETAAPTMLRPVDGLPTAAEIGAYRGFVQYRTTIAGGGVLTVGEVRDRAVIMLDGAVLGVLEREFHQNALVVPADANGELTILIELGGGINYGRLLGSPRGLIGPVLLDGAELHGWAAGVVPLDDTAAITRRLTTHDASLPVAGPAFVGGEFVLNEPTDMFLATDGWQQGVVWINGFMLGRHTARGPQRTMYVPAPVLRSGTNEILVFETRAARRAAVTFESEPDLGPTER